MWRPRTEALCALCDVVYAQRRCAHFSTTHLPAHLPRRTSKAVYTSQNGVHNGGQRTQRRRCRAFPGNLKFSLASPRGICILFSCANAPHQFPGGAVVAQLTVNQRVVGSNPTRGARNFRGRRVCPFGLFSVLGGCPRNCFPCTGGVWEFGRLSDDDLEIVVLVLGTSRNAASCPAVRLPSVTTSPVHRVQRDKAMVF